MDDCTQFDYGQSVYSLPFPFQNQVQHREARDMPREVYFDDVRIEASVVVYEDRYQVLFTDDEAPEGWHLGGFWDVKIYSGDHVTESWLAVCVPAHSPEGDT